MRLICSGLIAMLAAGTSCALGAGKDTPMPLEIFVAGRGKDTDAGTRDKPFATLERTRREVRRLRKDPSFGKSGITVWIAGGRYERTRTFVLGPEDSGSKNAPVVWRACEGQEVRLSGGRRLPSSAFRPVTDQAILRRLDPAARGKVLMTDLKALGISDFGTLQPRGFGHSFTTSALELFFNDKPMTPARWPNEGFVKTGKVIDTGAEIVRPGAVRTKKEDLSKLRPCFVFSNDRIKRWTTAEDIWAYGYWRWDWADESLPVQTVDAEKGQIKLKRGHHYGLKEGKRFYVFNLLEEIDSPGEWWLDRKSGILYLWPPEPIEKARVVVSLLDGPIVEMKGCSGVVLRGLTIEAGRGVGVRIEGGADNLVAGCTLRNLGTWAVQIGKRLAGHAVQRTHGGRRNGVRSCEITLTGEGGIHLAGGDRKTLTPGNNFAVNNHIHHWSRTARTYQAAVHLLGVGNRVAHNHIHDAPHTAVFFWGNDHIVEYNDVHDVCQETADAGAFYIGRDWSMRGNILRYNYIHQVGRYASVVGGFHGTMAIYLDDWASGTLVEGNLIVGAYYGIMVGSGRDNVLKNNIFAECSKGAVSFDARGLGWARNYFNGKTNTLFDRLKAVAHDRPPYSKRYPKLAGILKDEPVLPKGNRFIHNVCVGGQWIVYHNGMTAAITVQKGNLTSGDVGLVAPDKGDFRLRPDGPAVKAGVKPLPLDKIGQQPDEYRSGGTALQKKRVHRTDWMHKGSFGVMVHYLVYPQGKTADEKTASLNRIVDGFDLDLFVKQFEESGADWLIFTLGQNSGYYCSPNAWLDKALPGHTSRRDLALEISKRVKALGKHFIAYLPAEVKGQCADVHKAFAWNSDDQSEFEKRYPAFIRAYALKFGKNLDGWWYDGCYMKLPFMTKYDWPVWLAASRAGNPEAIVAFNAAEFIKGREKPITGLEDYIAGEIFKLPPPCMPKSRFVEGVQWHALMPLDGTFTGGKPHSYEDKILFDWVKRVKDVGGAVTLNIPISVGQGGTMQWFPEVKDAVNGQMHLPTIAQLKRLSKAIKATQKRYE